MEISSDEGMVGTQALDSLPEIQSVEELEALMKGSVDNKPDDKGGKAQQPQKPAAVTTTDSKADEGAGDDKTDEGEDDDDGTPKEFDKPSILHYLKDTFEFEMNLPEDREITRAEEAEGVAAIIQRMTDNVNQTVAEYEEVQALLDDEEIRELIEAKKQNKGLKDLYERFSKSPLALENDVLVTQNFQKKFPKSSAQAIEGMVKSLKDSGQFETFATDLRAQYAEDETLREQQEADQRKKNEQKEVEDFNNYVKEYATYIGTINKMYDVPITDEMKREVVKFDTQMDSEKMTKLDRYLQSKEGRAIASFAILYMGDLMTNSGSLKSNRKKTQFADQLFDDARQLQSSGGRGEDKGKEINWADANNF